MKKIVSLFLIATMALSLGACAKTSDGNATNDKTTATESSNADASAGYEYTFRDLSAPTYITPAEKFSGGNGTAEDPYQIATAEELALLSEKLNSDEGVREYASCSFILTADISLNDTENYTEWSKEAPKYSWKPMCSGANYFTGTFDGNNHTISGMYVNVNFDDKEMIDINAGLFGTVHGVVKNLNIDKSYVCASGYKGYVGGICGEAFGENSQLINCKSFVNIDVYDAECGGIVGQVLGGTQISDCEFSGNITQVKEKTSNNIGGIIGSGKAQIKNCENKGTITTDAIDVAYIAGIAGRFSEGSISSCKNSGKILGGTDTKGESVGVSAGGIVGSLFVSNIGGSEASTGVSVTDCENLGEVSGAYHTAGVVAEVSNDKSKNAITISGCKNSGKVSGSDKISGIVSLVNSEGANITVENCENTSEITGNEAGGIIREVFGVTGNLSVKNCKNSANITSDGLYSAGIVSYIMLSKDVDLKIDIENCTNDGKISTTSCGGGIIGFSDSATALSNTAETQLAIKKCRNNGDIYTSSNNAYIGGVAGNLGFAEIKTSLANCINTGSLEFADVAPDDETINAEANERFQLTRMCGGIVGRVGSGLVLVADSSKGDDANINKADGYVQISNCYSNGKFIVPAEDKYLNADGTPIYTNVIGGIIGSCTGENGFSVNVTDCGYSNTERGMGEKNFKNVGTKMSEKDIETKIGALN